ncbi:radical SAM protein [Thermoanaerobacterium sp. R66]|uniref:radical SAM/SPASM domain-containing protein n=1 Tax=Thermoanaerobacterium sp. R66 TaxID=2742479 RepID=UPI002380B287|nr:radical SAM protein [Thermoanaerobacterium sp. R66]MDE4541649.1 SPASM domain-containing protein [Thermoanaerobacterium sp. R66]
MLKKSKYNVEYYIDESNLLLFNTNTTSLVILDKETQNIYNDIEKIIDLSNFNAKIVRKIEALKNNGFLIDKDIDEYKIICAEERLSRYKNTELNLTIAPTMNCNMDCLYCYEDKYAKNMNEEVIKQLIEFVKKIIMENKIKRLKTFWYGGEPLLEKNIIKILSKNFIDICDNNNIDYESSIVTNGTLLDPDTVKMLKEECNITKAQITIDGLKEIHNKRRILKNGEDSFEIIVQNIDSAIKLLNIIIRINVDKDNFENIEQLMDFVIYKKHWDDKLKIYFSPVVKQTNACKADINKCFSQRDFGMLESKLLKLLYSKNANNLLDNLYPVCRKLFCTAISYNSYVIDPEGYLYTCWDLIGIKERSIGNLVDGIILNNEYVHWLTLDTPNQCIDCNLLPICNSGCPLERIKNNNRPMCSYKTISLKDNILINYNLFKQSGR